MTPWSPDITSDHITDNSTAGRVVGPRHAASARIGTATDGATGPCSVSWPTGLAEGPRGPRRVHGGPAGGGVCLTAGEWRVQVHRERWVGATAAAASLSRFRLGRLGLEATLLGPTVLEPHLPDREPRQNVCRTGNYTCRRREPACRTGNHAVRSEP